MKKSFAMAIISVSLSIATSVNADWSFVPLGSSAPGYSGYSSSANAINDSGQVVGYYDVSFPGGGATHAFMTGPNGVGITNLHPYDWTTGSSSFALEINNSGQVAGEAWTEDHSNLPHAFITSANGTGFTNLGAFGGLASNVRGINDSGQIAGQYDNNGFHAFITGPDGVGMTDLGIPNLTQYSISGINNSGQVVGDHAFVTVGYNYATNPRWTI